jgi:lysophospholipase L1-like esterase
VDGLVWLVFACASCNSVEQPIDVPGSGGTTVSGGASNAGGNPGTGGFPSGGATTITGGTAPATGGTSSGGVGIGGHVTGGSSTGGLAAGGTATGGKTTGGTATGGTATGGTATGGKATGGTATGGKATGGTSTGGTASGGTSTGGGAGAPGIRIVGRTAPGTSGTAVLPARFSWPGVNLHAQFTGTQASMDLTDGKNRFTVVIDNGTPKTVTGTSGSVSVATGLANGTHDLVIWRNTEASIGITQFTGLSNFGTGGGLVAPAVAPNKRIEVIGDSLSVGAGVEGNATCTGGIDAYTNNYLAYGSVAARAVGADVVTIAWSGIGVYRNYDGSTTNTMPSRYPYAVPSDTTLWDFALFQPQVTVINLGTNDFGAGDPGTAYETAYVNFVRTVRSKYASTYFILIDMYGGTRLTRINNVVATLKSGGESKVEMLSLSSVQNNLGCNQHPNVAAQAAMGGVLATRLRSLMGW